MTREFDLLWYFHGVQEKAMKHIQIFLWCENSWQFNGMENSWVMIIRLTGNFLMGHEDSQSTFLTLSQHFYGP